MPEIHSSNISLGSSGVDTFNCRVDAILDNLGTSSLKIGMPLASCNRSRALKVNLPLRNDVTVDQIRRVIIKQVQKAKYDQVGVLCFFPTRLRKQPPCLNNLSINVVLFPSCFLDIV